METNKQKKNPSYKGKSYNKPDVNEGKNEWSVYMHINVINGKRYIGITSMNPPERRWRQDGGGYKKQSLLWNAIQKYGWDNFKHYIILQNETLEYAMKVEKCLIKHYKTNDKRYGYNMTNGGEGIKGWVPSEEWRRKQSEIRKGKPLPETAIQNAKIANTGKIVSEETRRKISEARKGKYLGVNNKNFGKKHSEETKKKMSESRKGKRTGEESYWYGKHHSEETKEKLRKVHTGKQLSEEHKEKIRNWAKDHPDPKSKKVKCIETGQVFTSINEAQKIMNVSHVADCCKGKMKATKGYHFEFVEEEVKLNEAS